MKQLIILSAAQVSPVRLVSGPPSEPWPVGYTMTVWGVAVGSVALLAAAVAGWMRLSAFSKALLLQSVAWRLPPSWLAALHRAAKASGTPAAVLLVSRGAFDAAVERLSAAGCSASVARRLIQLGERVHGTGRVAP